MFDLSRYEIWVLHSFEVFGVVNGREMEKTVTNLLFRGYFVTQKLEKVFFAVVAKIMWAPQILFQKVSRNDKKCPR